MKRNFLLSFTEVFFPVILMMIGYFVRQAFPIETHKFAEEGPMEQFILDKSGMSFPPDILATNVLTMTQQLTNFAASQNITSKPLANLTDQEIAQLNVVLGTYFNSSMKIGHWVYEDKAGGLHPSNIPLYKGFSVKPLISTICYDRFVIAYIGDAFAEKEEATFDCNNTSTLLCQIAKAMLVIDGQLAGFEKYSFRKFESIEELNKYVQMKEYGKNGNDAICFGISAFQQKSQDAATPVSIKIRMHYFDNFIMEGIEDVPNNNVDPFQEMQVSYNNININF